MSPVTVSGIEVTGVDVPYERPIQTATATLRSAAWALIELETSMEDVRGRAYVRCYSPTALGPVVEMARGLAPLIRGRDLSPVEIWTDLRRRFRLLGCEGVVGLALNLIDMALWDALARSVQLPLVDLLGAESKPVAAYCSLRSVELGDLIEETDAALAAGFRAFKVKVGARSLTEDVATLAGLREHIGGEHDLMCDFNQSLTLDQALRAELALRDLSLRWIEEPLPAANRDGYRRLLDRSRTAIQAGESWWSPEEAARNVTTGTADLVMLDVARVGGVTGWLRAAGLAEAAGLRLSSHTFPEFSAHLLAAAPNADLLEWLDSAEPLVLAPLHCDRGEVAPRPGPGVGIEWDPERVSHHAVL